MNTPTQSTDQVTLYYREGSSDKVYQCRIEPQGERFVVNFAYGRRGSTLNTGTKTSSPVEYQQARQSFDKIVKEKLAKGYTPGADGTPYSQSSKEQQVSGLLPQLLNPIDEAEVTHLLHDPQWCMQEKMDGRRVLLRREGVVIEGINRKGLVIGLSSRILRSADEIAGHFILDGECVGEVFHAFDLLALEQESLQTMSYRHRLLALSGLLDDWQHPGIERIETAFTVEEKARFIERFRSEKREGVVFKRLDAPYTPGRPNSGGTQLKHKFYATLSAVVGAINAKRSVELRLFNGHAWQSAGNVTIPANHAIPAQGSVVEVRYLYAYRESGSLYQPVFLGLRQDVASPECVTAQLKFKPASEEDEP